MSSYRKKWEQSSSGAAPQIASKTPVPSQNVHTIAYDQYLATLQERNRLLKKLREKDARQIELEKKEQGFALYLNGANLSQGRGRPHPQAPPTSRKSKHPTSDHQHARPSKTADSNHIYSGDGFEDEESRAKTAPSKRKSWIHDSIELRTEDGDPIHVKAPGIFSGKYEDDFENTLTTENLTSTDVPAKGGATSDSPNLAQDGDSNDIAGRHSDGGQSDFDESAESEGEGGEDTLTVSFQDISTLRRSLELDHMIRESLASESTSNEGDSLNSSSGEESCVEEIEDDGNNSDPHSAAKASPDLTTTTSSSDGIVLQFAKIKSNHSKARNQIAKDGSLIQLSPSTALSLSSIKHTGGNGEKLGENGIRHGAMDFSEHGVEWMESEPSLASLATRSLSAVKRKEQHKKSVGNEEICGVDEVLEALKDENKSLTNLHMNMDTKPQLAGKKVGEMKKASQSFDNLKKSSSSIATTELESEKTAAPKIKGSLLLPSLPFRPVLVNRYKQATAATAAAAAAAKTLARPKDKAATITTTPPAREEDYTITTTTATAPRQPRASSTHSASQDDGGGEVQHVARESLTEQTVKIITDKVRQMDARKQRRLLRLLTRLDRQVSPPPAPPPPKPPSSSQDNQISTASSSDGGTVAMVTTSGPNPSHAPPPSWLRSKSIDSQDLLNSRPTFDDLDTTRNVRRSTSTRSSGIRSQLSMQQADGDYTEISKSQPNLIENPRGRIDDIIGESFIYSGGSKSQPNSRPVSGRKSGIQVEISSVAHGLHSRTDMSATRGEISSAVTSRPASRRMSGIRGQLHSRQKSRLDSRTPLSSASDPHLPTFLDAERETAPLSSGEPQRLQTAVLAKGRRALPLNASGSDTCLVPCIGDDDDDNDDVMVTPILSHAEPDISSTRFDVDRPHPSHRSERQSLNECLESISKFDHLHLGQIGSNIQDDVLESFLSEYREKRQHRQQKSSTEATAVGEGIDPFDSIDHSYSVTSSISTTATDTDWPPIPTTTSQQRDDRTSRDMEDSFDDDGEEGEGEYFFRTPEHPTGTELVLNLLSTWGDKFYIGLTGIEVYTSTGQPPTIAQISADPADINVLPEYGSDPRVVSNLLDGVNQTRDDLHMWLAPFTPGHTHIVRITFTKPTTLAMVRIWNYNKSRIHSSRGARLAEMYLDGAIIFQGEIARASGGVGGAEGSETILFTADAEVLSLVAEHDPLYQEEVGGGRESDDSEGGHGREEEEWEGERVEVQRPQTADRDDPSDRSETDVMQQYYSSVDQRPFTTARTTLQQPGERRESIQSDSARDEKHKIFPHSSDFELKSSSSSQIITGRVVELCLMESWGDPGYIGLTSVALLGADTREPLHLRDDQLKKEGLEKGGENNMGALVDGVDVTTDMEHMYLCPTATTDTMMSSGHVTITLTLDTPTRLYGMRIWNYNASLEDSYKGVKVLQVYVDGELVFPQSGYLIRRAPGHAHYDYGQTLSFLPPHSGGGEGLTDHHSTAESNSQADPQLPRGFVYQLQLLSSWGDPYYIGLNGLEIYDEAGQKIHFSLNNIAAFPDSVNVLPGVKGDLRTVDKLVDGVYDSRDGRHMWLAPILPHTLNCVYVIFDQPRTVSQVRLWNYAKTPSRGVKEFMLLVDDLLVYSGTLPPIPSHAQGILPTIRPPMKPYIVTLTDSDLCNEDDGYGRGQQLDGAEFGGDIQFTNNRRVVCAPSKPTQPIANQDLRPLTSLTSHTHRLRSNLW